MQHVRSGRCDPPDHLLAHEAICLSVANMHVLHLRVVEQGLQALLPPKSALPVATKRQFNASTVTVDEDLPCPNFCSSVVRFPNITSPHYCRQTVFRLIS